MRISRRQFVQAAGALTVNFSIPIAAARTSTAIGGSATLGNRLVVDSSGAVRLLMGKAELGQGIGTAMAQLVAEELDVSLERIRLLPVNTEHSPDESYTVGSNSVQRSGPPTRQAAATARHFFLNRAAVELGVGKARLNIADGRFLLDGKPSGLDYWQLLNDQQNTIEIDKAAALKDVDDYSIVGHSPVRLDIPRKVFGGESFLQDVRLPRMVHARIVRPPAERATLKRADFRDAERMPGVIKVVHSRDFVGVIAKREGQARAAAEALRNTLKWDLPEDLPDPDRLYDELKSTIAETASVVDEQTDFGGAAATRTVRASYQRPFQAHASISPSAAVATYAGGQLTVFSHAQGMYPLRKALAHVFGLPLERVRCCHYEAAGCFGHNGADDAACDAAALAIEYPGRPVRLQWERADEFAGEPYGSAMHVEVSASIDRSGHIREWNLDLWSYPHAGRPGGANAAGHLAYAREREKPLPMPPIRLIPQPSGGADRNAVPLYGFDNLTVTKHVLKDVPIRVSSLRGLGAYANVFAIESFMDELANVVGEDPFEYRLRHLDDERAVIVLEKLRDVTGWASRHADDKGWGLGFAQFKNRASYVGVVVQLQASDDGGEISLVKATAVCDAGLIISPDGIKAQIEGGIIQSASMTLKEQVRFDQKQKLSLNWATYPILRFDEVPEVEVVLIDRRDRPSLGVGESAQGPTAAAIANALFDATGIRKRRLPLLE